MLLKNTAEVGCAAEAASVADLTDGERGVRQVAFCGNDPGLKDIVHDRDAGYLFKLTAEMIF